MNARRAKMNIQQRIGEIDSQHALWTSYLVMLRKQIVFQYLNPRNTLRKTLRLHLSGRCRGPPQHPISMPS